MLYTLQVALLLIVFVTVLRTMVAEIRGAWPAVLRTMNPRDTPDHVIRYTITPVPAAVTTPARNRAFDDYRIAA